MFLGIYESVAGSEESLKGGKGKMIFSDKILREVSLGSNWK